MRITNGMIMDRFNRNLNMNLQKLSDLQRQMESSNRIVRLSDDPVGVIGSMQARVTLYRVEQYKKNVENAQDWTSIGEDAIMDINNRLIDCMTETVNGATDTNTAENRESIAQYIDQMRQHIVDVGNTKIHDKYIFGGYNTLTPPFTYDDSTPPDLLYNGVSLKGLDQTDPQFSDLMGEVLREEVGFGLLTDLSIPGVQLFGTGPDNLYGALTQLYDALMTPSDPLLIDDPLNPGGEQIANPKVPLYDQQKEISACITKLQNCQKSVLSLTAEYGGRTNRLDIIQARNEKDILNYTEIKSRIEDADMSEVITKMKMAESVYQASLSMGARIIQPTLMDFLR